jgi:hypothetical protein
MVVGQTTGSAEKGEGIAAARRAVELQDRRRGGGDLKRQAGVRDEGAAQGQSTA